jgi:adenylate cyclase, class 2
VQGVLSQRDTYFRVQHGRLKLREEVGAKAHLIAYERPDLATQRQSRYRIVTVDDAGELKAALESTLGIAVVVAKERHLFIWDEVVRIHLDRVHGLGHFIEFEAVMGGGDNALATAEAQVERLRQVFGVEDADLLACSYSDLALSDAPTPT